MSFKFNEVKYFINEEEEIKLEQVVMRCLDNTPLIIRGQEYWVFPKKPVDYIEEIITGRYTSGLEQGREEMIDYISSFFIEMVDEKSSRKLDDIFPWLGER